MFLWIYAAVLVSGILLLKRKKRADLAKGDQSQVGYGMAGGLFAGVMIVGGLLAFFMQLMTYHYYLFFTESRKQTVAAEMGMLDSADVRYTKFSSAFGGPDGTNRSLTLRCRISSAGTAAPAFLSTSITGVAIGSSAMRTEANGTA